MEENNEYTEFRNALKSVRSANKVRDLAASEGFELIPGCTDRDMLVYDLWTKRQARKLNPDVGSPSVTPPPLAPDAEGEPALSEPPTPAAQSLSMPEPPEPLVVVRTRSVQSRFRAKHRFTMKAQTFPQGHFSPEEWALIKADRELVVKWPTPQ